MLETPDEMQAPAGGVSCHTGCRVGEQGVQAAGLLAVEYAVTCAVLAARFFRWQ
jgi:hypothetical protein